MMANHTDSSLSDPLTDFDVAWEACVQSASRADVFHSLEWQRLIQHVYNVQPVYRLIRNNDEFAALTAFKVRSFLSGRKISTMPFNFYPNPLYSSEARLKELLLGLREQALVEGIACVEIKTTEPLPEEIAAETELIETCPVFNSVLLLPDDYSSFFRNLSKSMRQNLRTLRNRAAREEVSFSMVTSEAELSEFYNLLARTYRDRHHMVCHPYELYLQLFHHSGSHFKFEVLTARVDGVLASAIVVLYGNRRRAYYSWAATADAYRRLGPNYLLLDKLIEELISLGYTSLGFGTTPISDEKLQFFKDRWKCETKPVYYYYFFRPQHQVDLNKSYKFLRSIYSMLPISVIRWLMPIVVPQLA